MADQRPSRTPAVCFSGDDLWPPRRAADKWQSPQCRRRKARQDERARLRGDRSSDSGQILVFGAEPAPYVRVYVDTGAEAHDLATFRGSEECPSFARGNSFAKEYELGDQKVERRRVCHTRSMNRCGRSWCRIAANVEFAAISCPVSEKRPPPPPRVTLAPELLGASVTHGRGKSAAAGTVRAREQCGRENSAAAGTVRARISLRPTPAQRRTP